MKTISSLVYVLIFSSIILIVPQAKSQNTYDANYNIQLPFKGLIADPPFQTASILSTVSYDSVRPLTEINTPGSDAYPWISPDGLRLYYTNGANNNQLSYTSRQNTSSYFDPPVTIPLIANVASSFWLSVDELDAYICTDTELYYAHRTTISSPFNTPVPISLNLPVGTYVKGASLNYAQDKLFLSSYYLGTYEGIFEFSRTSPTSFAYDRTLPYPQGYIVQVGQLSKDELSFHFSASIGNGFASLYELTRASVTDSFDITTWQQIQNIGNTAYSYSQPSTSNNLEWLAFARNPSGFWTGNDLCIAHAGNISSVFPDEKSLQVYPNPVTGILYIECGNYQNTLLTIYNMQGQLMKHSILTEEKNRIDISSLTGGIYIIKISLADSEQVFRIIRY